MPIPAGRALRALLPAAALIASAFAATSAFAQANLLQNGSFESSYFNDSTATSQGIGYVSSPPGGVGGRATVPNWSWTAGSLSPSTFAMNVTGGNLGVAAEDGSHSVSFGTGSAVSGGSISQSFAPTSGAHCKISFWVRRIGAGQAIGATVSVTDNTNNSAVTLTDSGGTSHAGAYTVPIPGTANVWSQVTVTFTAPSANLTFTFTDTTPFASADSTDLGLDNVVISQKTLQTLTFLGGVGNQGDIAANTEYSNDGDVTWHPAYLSGGHPWGFIAGTNSWINQSSSPFVGLNQTTDFRVRFNLPADFEQGSMSFKVNADNYSDLSINGHVLSSTFGGTSPSLVTADGSALLPGQINTLNIKLTDWGGWVGINYVLTLTGYSDSTPTIVAVAPVITSGLSATGTVGMPFTYAIQAANTPSSYAASNLPAGLSINSFTGVISGTPTAVGTTNVGISATNSGGTTSATLVISINKGAATVTLGGLSQVYDGSAKSATATTSPANLTVNFSYTGAALPPVNAGVYGVIGSVSDANYTGSATGNMTIAKAALGITFGNLTQTYNGSGHSVTVTTSPAGVATTLTYNGGSSLPVNAGSYSVAGVSANANYTGTASATLVIAPQPTTISFSNLVQSYDGTPKTVTTSTSPLNVPVTVTYNGSASAPTPVGNYTVVAATADANYTGSASATLQIKDTTPPVIAALANLTAEATSAAGAVVAFTGSATDDVDGTDVVTFSPVSGSTFPIGVTTVTASARDAAGNPSSNTFTVTVKDTTAPMILGQTHFAESFASYSGISTGGQVQSGLNVFYGGTIVGWNNSGFHAVHAVDRSGSGNLAAMLYDDNVITLASGVTANSAGTNYAVAFTASPAVYGALSQATATTDGLLIEVLRADGSVLAQSSAQPGAWAGAMVFSGYSFTYTGDGSGPVRLRISSLAAGDGRFGGAIDDVVIAEAVPADVTLEATSVSGAVASFSPTAIDRVSGYTAVTASPVSGSTFPIGTTPVTLTSTDANGNVATSSFNVIVTDTTPPVITGPGDQTAEATSAAGAVVTFSASANDIGDGAVAVTASPASGSTFPIGVTVVTLTSTDAHGNHATSTFTVNVKDTTPPVITGPGNLTAEATSAAGAAVTFSTSATDIVDGATAVTAVPASGSTFALGTTTVTLTSTDVHGNTSSSTFTVTVQDTTAPALTVPANQVLEATSANGAVATFAASATDAVTASPALSYSKASGSTFALGTTTVTVTAKDAAGNVSTGTFTITVRDTTAPVITAPAPIVAEATAASGATVTFAASATDIVDGATAVTAAPASGSTFALGTTTVTLTSTDAHGNTATRTFPVTVRDTTPPALTLPANQVVEATSGAGAVATFAASATDAVSTPTLSYSAASGSTFALGVNTVSVTATDAAGNHTTGSFTITVRDTTPPALTVPASQTLEATSAAGAVATFAATATDAVSTPTITYSAASGSTFAIGTTTVTVTATDAAGNKSTGTFAVTVRDTTAPQIASISASPNTIWPPNKKMVAVTISAPTTDVVGVASVKIVSVTTNEPDSKVQWQITGPLTLNLLADRRGEGKGRIYTITVRASDAAGNVSTKAVTVTVPHDQEDKSESNDKSDSEKSGKSSASKSGEKSDK